MEVRGFCLEITLVPTEIGGTMGPRAGLEGYQQKISYPYYYCPARSYLLYWLRDLGYLSKQEWGHYHFFANSLSGYVNLSCSTTEEFINFDSLQDSYSSYMCYGIFFCENVPQFFPHLNVTNLSSCTNETQTEIMTELVSLQWSDEVWI
jgi:hypothetical protein